MTRHSIALCLLLGVVPWPAQTTQNTGQAGGLQREPFSVRVLTTGLESPWELTWGPDEHLWVTERTGRRVTRVNASDGSKTTAITIPEVYQSVGQDGLLGMALHPRLLRGAGTDYVYVAYTYDADPGPGVTPRGTIRRYTYDAGTQSLRSPVDLVVNLPAHNDHVSGRLIVGPDQKLYFTVGDQGSNFGRANFCNPNRAQELPSVAEVRAQDWTTYQGKLLRLNLDGSIPSDNPTIAGVRSHIYSYGHRNAQGMVFGPDGKLYASEHGPGTDDELNLIEAGKNYGWPHVAGYKDDRAYVYGNWSASSPTPCRALSYSSLAIPPSVPQQKESAWSHADFSPPLKTFFTVADGHDFQAQGSATVAPSGLDVYTASRDGIPGWANSLLMLSLTKGTVYRLKLSPDGRSIVGEALESFKSTNRYRDIAIHRNNRTIYLSTDTEGPTTDPSGATTRTLDNPGAILEFSYKGAAGR